MSRKCQVNLIFSFPQHKLYMTWTKLHRHNVDVEHNIYHATFSIVWKEERKSTVVLCSSVLLTSPSSEKGAVKLLFLLQYAVDTLGDEGFFDLLSRFQGNRMDDQRCSIQDGHNRIPSTSLLTTLPVASKKCELAPTPTNRLMLT